jgi:hypothetical protein
MADIRLQVKHIDGSGYSESPFGNRFMRGHGFQLRVWNGRFQMSFAPEDEYKAKWMFEMMMLNSHKYLFDACVGDEVRYADCTISEHMGPIGDEGSLLFTVYKKDEPRRLLNPNTFINPNTFTVESLS